MVIVKSYEEIPNPRVQRDLPNGKFLWRSDFVKAPADKSIDSPMAFLAEGSPGRVVRPHFHEVDQFQVIYVGAATLGTHDLKYGAVHFSRAYTPYGPIKSYGEDCLGFVTLRAHRDSGAQYMPQSRPVLDSVENRSPWQISAMADFDLQPGANGVAIKAIDGIKDGRGLDAYSMLMRPGAKAFAPEPSRSDGQYIVIMKGSVVHAGQLKKGLAVIWVDQQEGPFQLIAGADGCEVVILNFPIPGGGVPETAKPVSADGHGDFKTYQCVLCAFVYDEANGLPEAGIAAGTRWADVPATFGCPDCAATKADFEMIEL